MPAKKQRKQDRNYQGEADVRAASHVEEDAVKVDIDSQDARDAKDAKPDAQAQEPEVVEETQAASQDVEEPVVESAADTDELAQAKAIAAAAQDRYLRLQAEWDNFRKRTAQEAESQKLRATERLLEALIPVIDDLERAIEHAEKTGPQGEFKSFVEGVEAVYAKFVSTLETKAKLEVIDPKDEPFDALKHQAVGTVDNPDVYDETVAAVYQKGYELGGYVIRPAMVTVTTGGKPRPQED